MIKFKNLYIEGFSSYIEPIIYKLDSPGINLILGHNGSGKSTIIKALLWVLYKKNYKEPWEDIKDEPWEGTKVSVRFRSGTDKVKIIRCKSFKRKIGETNGRDRLFLYVNGKSRDDLRDKADIEREIQKLLGMSANLFTNSIIFGQGLSRFLKEKGPQQKTIFDEAFNTLYINEAKIKASEDLYKIEVELDIVISTLSNIKTKKDSNNDVIKVKEEYLDKIKKNQKDLDKKIKDAEAEIKSLFKTEKEKKKISDRLKEKKLELEHVENLRNDHFKNDLKVVQLEGNLTDYKNDSNELLKKGLCPNCGQKLPKKDITKKINLLKNKITSTREELGELSTRQAEIYSSDSSLDKLNDIIDNDSNQLEKLNNIINKAESTKKYIAQLKEYSDETGFKNIGAELLELNTKALKLKKKLKSLKTDKKRLIKEQDSLRWLINMPLSNKGIKAYIFESRLEEINTELEKYTKLTGYKVQFFIDMESGNKNFESLIYRGDKIRPYDDLSGGQQQMVDVCLIFAVHAVLTSWSNINILMMDEVFESLDEENIQLVSDLIMLKSENLSIHLMTHQLQFVIKSTKITSFRLNELGQTQVN